MTDVQLKLIEATEKFCTENPDLFYSKDVKTWFRYDGKVFRDATDRFN